MSVDVSEATVEVDLTRGPGKMASSLIVDGESIAADVTSLHLSANPREAHLTLRLDGLDTSVDVLIPALLVRVVGTLSDPTRRVLLALAKPDEPGEAGDTT